MRTVLLMPLLIALSALLPSCSEFGSYRLVTAGFRFDYGGSTALREESGPLPEGTRVGRVDHRFGDVDIAPRSEGSGPGWRWTVETWADEPEVGDEITVGTIEYRVLERDEQVWRWHDKSRVQRIVFCKEWSG